MVFGETGLCWWAPFPSSSFLVCVFGGDESNSKSFFFRVVISAHSILTHPILHSTVRRSGLLCWYLIKLCLTSHRLGFRVYDATLYISEFVSLFPTPLSYTQSRTTQLANRLETGSTWARSHDCSRRINWTWTHTSRYSSIPIPLLPPILSTCFRIHLIKFQFDVPQRSQVTAR